jgi:hypothetical protein
MKRLAVFILAALLACLLGFGSCYAQTDARQDSSAIAQSSVAPPPPQGGSPGQWVQVPGESIGDKWVPPHRVWLPAPPTVGQAAPQYAPVRTYVVLPPPTFASVLSDILILRPLGIAGMALGTAGAVVATPFALPSGSMGEVGRTLIICPYDFTFNRPLGVW